MLHGVHGFLLSVGTTFHITVHKIIGIIRKGKHKAVWLTFRIIWYDERSGYAHQLIFLTIIIQNSSKRILVDPFRQYFVDNHLVSCSQLASGLDFQIHKLEITRWNTHYIGIKKLFSSLCKVKRCIGNTVQIIAIGSNDIFHSRTFTDFFYKNSLCRNIQKRKFKRNAQNPFLIR